MFCGKCGKEIADGKKFCPYCGNSLTGAPAPAMHVPNAAADQTIGSVKKKTKFAINKAMIITFVEIVALIALIWGFLKIGESVFGPKALVNEYMKALAEDDWDTIMNLTEVGESEFTDREALKNAISEYVSGDFDSFDIRLKNSRGNSAKVQIKYGSEGSNRNSLDLELVKQDDKAFIIFDTWKVSGDNFIVEDFAIYAPKGTDAWLDGKKLDENLIKNGFVPDVENADDNYQVYNKYNAFVIPQIYMGKHMAAALIGDYAISAADFQASKDNKYVILESISSTEELQEEIVNIAYNDLERIIEAKLNRQDFDDISDLFVDNRDYRENASRNYEYSADYYYNPENKSGIKKVEIKDAHGGLSDFFMSDEGELNAQVGIDVVYDTTVYSRNWWDEDKIEKEKREDLNGNLYAYMVYENGEWKLREIQIPSGL